MILSPVDEISCGQRYTKKPIEKCVAEAETHAGILSDFIYYVLWSDFNDSNIRMVFLVPCQNRTIINSIFIHESSHFLRFSEF